MSKYLDFTNEINLPVHRKTSGNDMKKTKVLHNIFSSVFIGNHLFFKVPNLNPGTGGKKIGKSGSRPYEEHEYTQVHGTQHR